jgi:hypothetical protein
MATFTTDLDNASTGEPAGSDPDSARDRLTPRRGQADFQVTSECTLVEFLDEVAFG